ncbi:uncharacterized protein DUF948 [Actinomadura pelletieri DSM 43383]|uniref:Uncharacterized protein DUF948 n=1 Tax=Actinomadura pelletieri DSM 43383 TaxID=1120940 RepID=A0A495Q948_9ACTN|nr:DUF948 domain-containing protein [Actinomadura pelletieri]RKS67835.1 uncharacterized protein DUF948 [Actinomadura pelletieri DSM 43383]
MLTGGQLAGLIVAVFWAVLVTFIALTLLRLARLLREASEVVRDFGEQAGPLLDDMTRTVRRANEQLGRTDVITKQVAGVTQNVSAVTTVMSSVMGGPLVKAAAFSYGVRKALANRDDGARRESGERALQARSSGRGRR